MPHYLKCVVEKHDGVESTGFRLIDLDVSPFPLNSLVTLSLLLNFSKLQFPHLQDDNKSSCLIELF